MGEQKIGDKLRLLVQASAINGWTKFIEDTFPELEAAAEKGQTTRSYERTAEKLSEDQELQIKNHIYEKYGLALRFERCTVRAFVDSVTISWDEE